MERIDLTEKASFPEQFTRQRKQGSDPDLQEEKPQSVPYYSSGGASDLGR